MADVTIHDPFGIADTFATDVQVIDCGEYVRLSWYIDGPCMTPVTEPGDALVVARIVVPAMRYREIWESFKDEMTGTGIVPK